MSEEFISALDALTKERNIDRDVLLSAIEAALISAYKRNYNAGNVSVAIDSVTGNVQVFASKTVREEVENENLDMSLDQARTIDPRFKVGDIVKVEVTPRKFGRIAAQTAKQVVVQRIREAESGKIYSEYVEKENEILTAIVERMEGKQVLVELGRTHGLLDVPQQMPGEEYHVNDRIKVYVLEVLRQQKGPQVMVSRIHPGLVKRLFEIEVPEIRDGIVLIKSIAREAGFRTKMAVTSTDPMVDPVGSCVGPRGMRVENVVAELKDEKIDIIKWSADPQEYIANALNPARVLGVYVSEKDKSARVIVPDNQLSLAIGKEGQNARLAAKLTGWRIDIKSQSQAEAALLGGEGEPAVGESESAPAE
ncbi:MAG: transcription termination factor NusA [Candidatus Fimadaptatus sp.]